MTDEHAQERLIALVNRALDAGVARFQIIKVTRGSRLWAAVNGKGIEAQLQFLERQLERMRDAP